MKRLIISGLSVLLFAGAMAPAVSAKDKDTALNSATSNSINKNQLTPFELVSLAYQGNLKDQGIPSAGGLLAAYQIGQVSAETLVQKAVAANMLSPAVLNDQGYLNAVNNQLSNLEIYR
ncbi:MAG: hypothetical protein JOZ78_10380 [Chroococcidiopsidaceae cyanobacterium CP_BM_ER_R8_30]|nr:hypothetical protein [Chroococcidiopsidaceae cyanobacterium CP_BM_ER_R8_30]